MLVTDRPSTTPQLAFPSELSDSSGSALNDLGLDLTRLHIAEPSFSHTEHDLTFFANPPPEHAPRTFKHHFEEFADVNLECPLSPDDITSEPASSVQFRYSRNNRALCRFCRHKRWIAFENWNTHLTMAHGIVPLDGEVLFLPLPAQVSLLAAGKFKTWSCQCPKCENWITLRNDNRERSQLECVGLYTSFFEHIMGCL